MNLALNNLERLICHKNNQTNNLTFSSAFKCRDLVDKIGE